MTHGGKKTTTTTDLLDFQKTLFWVIWGWALCHGTYLTFRINNRSHSWNHRASHAKAKCQQHPQETQLHKNIITGRIFMDSPFPRAFSLVRWPDRSQRDRLGWASFHDSAPWREGRQMRLEAGDRSAGESVGRWEQPVADGARWNSTAPQT